MSAIIETRPIPWTHDTKDERRGYDRFRVTGWIEPGEYGDVAVRLTEPKTREQAALTGLLERATVRAGEAYTRLHVRGTLWMSDTEDEYRDHVGFIHAATGRVLIHGLGLGCSLKAILHNPDVTHVDVVEIDAGVLDVIGPYYAQDPRVNLIHDDALTRRWPVGMEWDAVWHDIWAYKTEDDRPERTLLNRRFGRRAGWQGGWAQEFLDYRRRRDRAHAWW